MAKLSYPETEESHTKTQEDVYIENMYVSPVHCAHKHTVYINTVYKLINNFLYCFGMCKYSG